MVLILDDSFGAKFHRRKVFRQLFSFSSYHVYIRDPHYLVKQVFLVPEIMVDCGSLATRRIPNVAYRRAVVAFCIKQPQRMAADNIFQNITSVL